MSEETPPIEAKADPALFALRAAAPRPVRVRRGALIGLSTCVVALIAGAVMLALHAPAPIAAPLAEDGRPADPAAANEALATGPAGYASVPVLGPPLNGFGAVTGTPSPSGGADEVAPIADGTVSGGKAVAEPDQIDTKGADIGKSPVLISLSSRAAAANDADAPAPPPPSSVALGSSPVAPSVDVDARSDTASVADGDPNHQAHKVAFLRAGTPAEGVNPHVLMPAASRWMVSAGSIIAASLITGVNSDLPGEVTAQVTENVYDSPTGQTLLIPQGSRLIGSNDNGVSYGQKRALIVWRRLILPDGSSIQLDNWPAADKAGATGLADKVDGHSWQLIKGVALSTLLGIGSELSYGSSDSNLARALRQSVESGSDRAGQQLVSKSLDVQPTIRVRPGWPVRVVVHQDLLLQPWHPQGSNP
jgi:type IV secretion system protein VirB10